VIPEKPEKTPTELGVVWPLPFRFALEMLVVECRKAML